MSVVDPSADTLWTAVGTIVTDQGVQEVRPRTQEEWDAVRTAAVHLVESSHRPARKRRGCRARGPGRLEPPRGGFHPGLHADARCHRPARPGAHVLRGRTAGSGPAHPVTAATGTPRSRRGGGFRRCSGAPRRSVRRPGEAWFPHPALLRRVHGERQGFHAYNVVRGFRF